MRLFEAVDKGYSIKWTKANLQKIVSTIGLRKDPPVSCCIVAPNGIKIHVDGVEDLLNGSSEPEALLHFGRIPTEHERKLWLERDGGKAGRSAYLSKHCQKEGHAWFT